MPMPIAPWVVPPDYSRVMEAGANAGIALRRTADEEAESQDRLSLAYNQLASQERRADEAARSKLQLAHATLAYRQQTAEAARALREKQLDATDAYHQGMLDQRDYANQLRQENMDRLAAQFGTRMDFNRSEAERKQGNFDTAQAGITDRFNTRQENIDQMREDKLKAREERLAFEREKLDFEKEKASKYPGKLDPAAQALLDIDKGSLKSAQKQIDQIDEAGGPSSGFFGIGSNKKKYDALKKREAELLTQIQGYQKDQGTTKAKEVTRMTKDGRKAIFDADTKQFLRYAD